MNYYCSIAKFLSKNMPFFQRRGRMQVTTPDNRTLMKMRDLNQRWIVASNAVRNFTPGFWRAPQLLVCLLLWLSVWSTNWLTNSVLLKALVRLVCYKWFYRSCNLIISCYISTTVLVRITFCYYSHISLLQNGIFSLGCYLANDHPSYVVIFNGY